VVRLSLPASVAGRNSRLGEALPLPLLRTGREFFAKYFDERGWLLCVERWGGDDGPDDAIENCLDWPVLHALSGDHDILALDKRAWEGHLRQYTLARTTAVPFARDGMYYKEFPVMMDWLHNAEGLVVINLQGLSDPLDAAFAQCARRFAGFDPNEDLGATAWSPTEISFRLALDWMSNLAERPDELAADRVSVTLVNVDQLESRRVIVQVGGYAEHRFVAVLTFTMKRYSQSPTLAWPW
jgi:hypothetical protein